MKFRPRCRGALLNLGKREMEMGVNFSRSTGRNNISDGLNSRPAVDFAHCSISGLPATLTADQGRFPVHKLAIVIPALGGADLLEEGLVSVLQHRPNHAEVLVVLTEPYSDPYDLKDEVQFVVAPRNASLVKCLQLGLAASQAPLVHFLTSGRQVEEDWADLALAHFDHPEVAAVVPVTVPQAARPAGFAGIRYSSGGRRSLRRLPKKTRGPVEVLGPELSAAFYRRSALEALGGLSEEVGDELADVELALAIGQAGWRTVLEPASRVHEASRSGVARSGAFRQGLNAERLFWRNLPARGWFGSLVTHPWVLATAPLRTGSPVGMVTHALGRLVGLGQAPFAGKHRRWLKQLREQPPVLCVAQNEGAAPAEEQISLRFDAAHDTPAKPFIETTHTYRRAS